MFTEVKEQKAEGRLSQTFIQQGTFKKLVHWLHFADPGAASVYSTDTTVGLDTFLYACQGFTGI